MQALRTYQENKNMGNNLVVIFDRILEVFYDERLFEYVPESARDLLLQILSDGRCLRRIVSHIAHLTGRPCPPAPNSPPQTRPWIRQQFPGQRWPRPLSHPQCFTPRFPHQRWPRHGWPLGRLTSIPGGYWPFFRIISYHCCIIVLYLDDKDLRITKIYSL